MNSETNQIYLKKVINDDVYLKNKYGHISGYWVKKVGRAFGPVVGESSEIKHYDIYVNGEKRMALLL